MAQDRLTRQQRRQIRELLATHDPLIRAAFIQAIRNARGALDFDALTAAVRANDLQRAFDLLRLNQAVLWPLEEAIRAAIYAGGATVTLPRGVQGAFSFDGNHIRAQELVQQMGARLVTELGNPGFEPIRDIILTGQREGLGAQRTAQNLAGKLNRRTGIREGGIMGLDQPRADRAAKVRAILSDPDRIGEYFRGSDPRYKRTSRQFDSRVRKAIEQGKALSPDWVDRIAKDHEARLIKDRSQTIAANETFRAQAQGRREAYAQLMESGAVESIQKRWNHNTFKDPRPDHARLDGVEVGFNEAFPAMDDGSMLQFPHDPAAGPNHSVSCKCTVIYIPQYRRPT
jgi:hypothetical protein